MPHKPPSLSQLTRRPRPSAAARGYGHVWRKLRRLVASECPAVCVRCGYAGPSREMHLDHIRARSKGGSNDTDNLQWLCRWCHTDKTNREDGGLGR
jgi:5-methylcytosine-specific restriction protein A